jgi:toxin CcdB
MIRQFDVILNPLRGARDVKPYLVCVQHRFLDDMNTRIVAPLVPRSAVLDQPRLYPAIQIEGKTLYFDPTDLVALPSRILKNPVANLAHDSFRITAALDLVFTGV